MKTVIFLISLIPLFGGEIDLALYEKSLYSEQGEDGVIAKLFQIVLPATRSCVEVGAYDGITHSNTFLLQLQGWNRLLFDRQFEIPTFNLHKEYINAENINQIFQKYNVPLLFDLLCIDLEYNSFYVWKALDPKYSPSVVVIQYNGNHPPDQDKVVKYRPFYVGDGTDYFGASILSLYRLGRAKGYSLVYAEQSGKHLFFVREALLPPETPFRAINQVDRLYRPRSHLYPHDMKARPYLSSEGL
ncbi:MAG: hypothetical protein WCF19_05430 [Chlamydiales bacterium]